MEIRRHQVLTLAIFQNKRGLVSVWRWPAEEQKRPIKK
jgi:hypothetical protein